MGRIARHIGIVNAANQLACIRTQDEQNKGRPTNTASASRTVNGHRSDQACHLKQCVACLPSSDKLPTLDSRDYGVFGLGRTPRFDNRVWTNATAGRCYSLDAARSAIFATARASAPFHRSTSSNRGEKISMKRLWVWLHAKTR